MEGLQPGSQMHSRRRFTLVGQPQVHLEGCKPLIGKFCDEHEKLRCVKCAKDHAAGSFQCENRPKPWGRATGPGGRTLNLRNGSLRTPFHPGFALVIRVLQANCRKSPDCTTNFLTKARGRAKMLLAQEFWADPRDDNGIWKTALDLNFWFVFDRSVTDGRRTASRAMIAVSKNPPVDYTIEVQERDLVAVKIGKGEDEILVVSIYNPNPDPLKVGPLRSERTLALLREHRQWVIGKDFNAHHPEWSRKERETNAQNTLNILAQGSLRIEPGAPTRRPDTDNQEPSTIDLVIMSTSAAQRVSEAIIADDNLTTGSDHEALAWKIHTRAEIET
jgi:hypothetical protein